MSAQLLDTPILVPELIFQPDGDDVVVGRHSNGAYVVLPPEAAALLQRLAGGMTPRQANAWYEREFGEEVDLPGFLEDLTELGVLPAPGQAAPDLPRAGAAPRVRWRRLAQTLFSPPFLAGYGLIVLAGLVTMVREPDLRPAYHHIFFTDYLTLVTIVLAVGQWPLILLHEAAHALAGRRLGLPTRMAISHRLNYLVIETAMDGLVTVPRRKRWLPMIAGMGCDVLIMAVLTMAAAVLRHGDGSLPLAGRLCLALSYGTLLRVVWQFFFYLRTDLYHLLSLVLGTVDLHGTATRLLRERLRRWWPKPARASHKTTSQKAMRREPPPHPADARAARWYLWLMVAGYALTLTIFLAAIVPLAIRFITEMAASLDGHDGIWRAVDSSVVFLLAAVQFAAVVVVAIRNRRADPLSRPSGG